MMSMPGRPLVQGPPSMNRGSLCHVRQPEQTCTSQVCYATHTRHMPSIAFVADDGWVDPEEVDMWSGLKRIGEKIFNFGGKNSIIEKGKPVVWASDYAKLKKEKGSKKKSGGKK